MADDEQSDKPEGKIEGTIKAVTGLVTAVPIYEDAVQPLAKEVGKALGTVGEAINAALSPIEGLIWGYEQIRGYVETTVAEKLKDVPEEDIISPPPHVVGPAMGALRFAGDADELRAMYANLIASSMNRNTSHEVHPSFVEIIKQLSIIDTKVIDQFAEEMIQPVVDLRPDYGENVSQGITFANCALIRNGSSTFHFVETSASLINLSRLGIIQMNYSVSLEAISYEKIEQDERFLDYLAHMDSVSKIKKKVVRGKMMTTDFVVCS